MYNTAPPSQKGGNNTRCISCKRAALYINLIQAPQCMKSKKSEIDSKKHLQVYVDIGQYQPVSFTNDQFALSNNIAEFSQPFATITKTTVQS